MNNHEYDRDVGVLFEGGELNFHKTDENIFAIKRQTYTQHEFDINHGGKYIKKTWKMKFLSKLKNAKKNICDKDKIKTCTKEKFPFFSIIKKYRWKEWFAADLITGLIIGIMHIPQSMAYAFLAGLKPIYGLYVSFFPVLVYFFFGTSRHVSIGTIAIMSLLTGKFLEASLQQFPLHSVSNSTFNDTLEIENEVIKAHRTAGFAFIVGIVQLIMGIFNLGFLTKYLSDPLISGFTVGASMHVFTSQVKFCFGLTIPKQFGVFNIIRTYYHVAKNIPKTNIPTLSLTIVCIIILFVTKEFINPHVVKKIRMPIPMELIVVIFGTVASKYLNLDTKYKVKCVGKISQGLPSPTLPDLTNLSYFTADILITAIIGFSVGVSLAKIFGKKHGYEVNTNQELLAYGMMNFLSSFFLCYPSATSLSRSAVQDAVGGKTQLTSIVSCILLLFVLLFIGPVFYSLPSCVLSAIIIVALKGMFMQFAELKELWLFSFWDFSTWVVAFLGTVFIDVEYGLIISIGYSILMIMLRTQSPKSHILGQVKGTDLYKNIDVYDQCQEIEGIKIFRYEGSLYYASSDHFKTSLYSKVNCDPRKISLQIFKLERKLKNLNKKITKEVEYSPFIEKKSIISAQLDIFKNPKMHHIIIDCSTWGYIDYVGVKTLNQVIEEYRSINITVILANPKTDVRATIFRNDSSNTIDDKIIYVSVHDAVIKSLYDHKLKISNVTNHGLNSTDDQAN